LSVKRSWADKNRALLVRFMRSMAQTYRWIYQNKEPAVDLLAQEMKLKRDHARRGWEFYTGTHMWHPDGDLNMDGLQVVVPISAAQTQLKGTGPKAAKYVDQSFLRDALNELGGR